MEPVPAERSDSRSLVIAMWTWLAATIGLCILCFTYARVNARLVSELLKMQAAEVHEGHWPYKIPAAMPNGEQIEICVYPIAMSDGGFVINVHTEEDKKNQDGECWGTVIYPGKKVEQKPLPNITPQTFPSTRNIDPTELIMPLYGEEDISYCQ